MNKPYLKFLGIFLFLNILFIPSISIGQTYSHEWRTRSSSLDRKIDDLDNKKVVELPIPILFGITPDNISRNFGDPRSGGRIHEGLDIMAPSRAPIVSPTEAVVIRTGEGESAGMYVYTANPGEETFAYMHLDEIADIEEGDELKKGDLIGYVGNTGNASGGAPHLHFEIRSDREATDPFPRLTRIFPLADKINYLDNILDDLDDSSKEKDALIKFIILEYSKELNLANTLNITLPPLIESVFKPSLTSIPTSPTTNSLNLTLGSRGSAVIALQKFLISKNIGSASRVIADGSFGPITQKALADYQAGVGISPASGYFGPITRAYIASNP